MRIGNAIKTNRKLKGIRQNTLAHDIKVSQTYISQIESDDGKKTASPTMLKKICEGIGIPYPVLIWDSLEVSDIPKDKQTVFEHVKPLVDSLLNKLR